MDVNSVNWTIVGWIFSTAVTADGILNLFRQTTFDWELYPSTPIYLYFAGL